MNKIIIMVKVQSTKIKLKIIKHTNLCLTHEIHRTKKRITSYFRRIFIFIFLQRYNDTFIRGHIFNFRNTEIGQERS